MIENTAIKPEDLATGEQQGSGFFEEIMRSVSSMVQTEYSKGRIQGDMYAQVFSNTLGAALQTANQFVLQYPVANKQMTLIDAQIQQTDEQTELVKAQIRNMDADTAIKTKQLLVMDKQMEQLDKQIALVDKQIEQATAQIDMMKKQEALLDEQILKTVQETELTRNNAANALNTHTTITKQQLKLDVETELLNQKVKTESAQINDLVDGLNVEGVVGKQKGLIEAQTKGFHTDGLLKGTKTYVDTWTVRQSTDGATADTAGLQDSEIMKMLNALQRDLGVS